jgi:hypothetical protein
MGQGVRKIIPLTIIPMTSSAFPETKRKAKNGAKKITCFYIFAPIFCLPFCCSAGRAWSNVILGCGYAAL